MALAIDAWSLPLIAGVVVAIVLLNTLSSAVYSLYSVSFYRDLIPTDTDGVFQV